MLTITFTIDVAKDNARQAADEQMTEAEYAEYLLKYITAADALADIEIGATLYRGSRGARHRLGGQIASIIKDATRVEVI